MDSEEAAEADAGDSVDSGEAAEVDEAGDSVGSEEAAEADEAGDSVDSEEAADVGEAEEEDETTGSDADTQANTTSKNVLPRRNMPPSFFARCNSNRVQHWHCAAKLQLQIAQESKEKFLSLRTRRQDVQEVSNSVVFEGWNLVLRKTQHKSQV